MFKASCIIHYDRKKIIAVSRKEGTIGLPGGKVEPGETNLQAAIREYKEEVRLDLHPTLFLFDPYVSQTKDFEVHTYLLCMSHSFLRDLRDTHIKINIPEFLERCSFKDYNTQLFKHFNRS